MFGPQDAEVVSKDLLRRIRLQLPNALELAADVETLGDKVSVSEIFAGLKHLKPIASAIFDSIESGSPSSVDDATLDGRDFARITISFTDQLPVGLTFTLRPFGGFSFPTMYYYTANLGRLRFTNAESVSVSTSGLFQRTAKFTGSSDIARQLNSDSQLQRSCGRLLRGRLKLGTFILVNKAPVFRLAANANGETLLLVGTVPIIAWHGMSFDCCARLFVDTAVAIRRLLT